MSIKSGLLCCLGLITFGQSSFSFAEDQNLKLEAPIFNNLSSYHRPISTKVPLAQQFFDQGLILLYGFEWEESIRSFKEAARLDPDCGMCYWGLALALVNKVNAPETGNEYKNGKAALDQALALSVYESPIERDYIKALALRFQHKPKSIKKAGAFSCHASGSQTDAASKKEMLAYARGMKNIVTKYPQDIDAKALYAGALFWTVAGNAPKENNPSIRAATKVLKEALTQDKLHIGANHYYIHLTEPFAHPEDALTSADLFKTLVPGSEHLMHMPTHIYFITGHYHEATNISLQAVETYKQYDKTCEAQGFKPAINFLYFHNYDFLRATASMEGRKQLALTAARQIEEEPFSSWQKLDPSGLQWFIPIPFFTEARFGLWDEIIKEPMPKADYQYALGMWHYARGLAFAKTGQIKAAQQEDNSLYEIIQKGPTNKNLGEQGFSLLKIAREVLSATLTNLQGNEKSTITHLKLAVKIQDGMGYHEPPDWYFPVKEALGEAYLEWGHPKEAENTFRQDLKQYPNNGWALYGLADSLHKLGEAKMASETEDQFKKSWKYSDIPYPVKLFP